MQINRRPRLHFRLLLTVGFLLTSPVLARSQNAAAPSSVGSEPDLKSLATLVGQLQLQVQTLNSQMSEVRTEQERALSETEQLRAELNRTKVQLALSRSVESSVPGLPPSPASSSSVASAPPKTTDGQTSLEDRVAKLEDNQDVVNGKMTEQSQTKVESGSKYRVRVRNRTPEHGHHSRLG